VRLCQIYIIGIQVQRLSFPIANVMFQQTGPVKSPTGKRAKLG